MARTSVFGTEFVDGIQYMRDVPTDRNMPPLPDNEKDMVMHVELPITGGHILMGTDMLESMNHALTCGNNVSINLEPDTRKETERLFKALSDGGEDVMPLQEMFWGGYFGSCADKFGVRWMFNSTEKE